MAENDVIPYKVGDIFVDEETGKEVQAMLTRDLPLGWGSKCAICFYHAKYCASPKLACSANKRPTKDSIYFKEVHSCTE